MDRDDGAVTADVHPEGVRGSALRYDENSAIRFLVESHAGTDRSTVTAHVDLPGIPYRTVLKIPGDTVRLRMTTHPPTPSFTPWSQGADRIVLAVTDGDGHDHVVAELDGRFWAVETAGPFTGRIIGILGQKGTTTFQAFSYRGEGGS